MTTSSRDPRVTEVAALSEQEFVGDLHVHGDNDAEALLDVYREVALQANLPEQPLIEPREGYALCYDPRPQRTPFVFLFFEGDLVGLFVDDNLTVGSEHRGNQLGRELILAGFAQAPWKNQQQRKVTKAGEGALRSAYRFAMEMNER